MHSSTSVSNQAGATRALVLLLGVLLVYSCALEVVARVGFPRASGIQRRIANEREEALALQPRTREGAPTVLFVGNSLLVYGVDAVRLRQEMAPRYHAAVFAVENTQFLDWYYGMRRLFAEGSRPAILIVCLSIRQLISQGTDGEYFAHYIMQKGDILAVKKAARLDMTTTSSFFFASNSAWLGSRASVRNWLLGELMPNIHRLTGYLPGKSPAMPPSEVVVEEGLSRLEALHALCANQGTHFMLLIPPSLHLDDRIDELQEAARRAGITVILPYRAAEMPASYFEDGFHLNSEGAVAFTERLAQALLREHPQN